MASLKKIIEDGRKSIGSSIAGKPVQKRLYGYGAEDEFYTISERFGTSQLSARDTALKANVGTVADCVDLIAERVSQYEAELYKRAENEEDEEEIKQHEFLDLLSNPQPNNPSGPTGADLLYSTQAFLLLCGEAFWYIPRGKTTKKPKEIILLKPSTVGLKIDKSTGEVTGYVIKKKSKNDVELEVEEVWHFKRPNLDNPYRGLGLVETHSTEILTDEFSSNFVKNFFKNNAGISGVLSLKGMVAGEVFKRFVRQWRQKYEGVDNAGKTAIMRDTDATFTKVGLGLDELDMKALKDMTKDDLLQAFRVPLPLLGKAEGAGLGRGNVESLEYIFAKYNIDPKMDYIDSMLQRMIDFYYPDEKLEIEHESTIPEDKEFEHKQETELLYKVYTVNEVRAKHGLPNVKGGDKLYVPNTMTAIDAQALAEVQNSIKIKKTIKKEMSDEDFFDESDVIQTRYEVKSLKELKRILNKQEKEVLDKAVLFGKEAQNQYFDQAEAEKELTEALLPLLMALLLVQGKLAMQFAGSDPADFAITATIEKEVADSVAKLAKNYTQDTVDALSKTISEGVLEQESVAKIKKRITSVYSDAKGYRAERIARTETLKASNFSTEQAYFQSGVTNKVWSTEPGACPICKALDGTIQKVGTTFFDMGQKIPYIDEKGKEKEYEVGYEDLKNPPVHSNCRCRIIPQRS